MRDRCDAAFLAYALLACLMCASQALASFTGAGQVREDDAQVVEGVALNGLLALEDWFFSWNGSSSPPPNYPFVEVSSPPNLPQGRHFPSLMVDDALVEPWISEGGLLNATAAAIGEAETIQALTMHRLTYIKDDDFDAMVANGIRYVRLPIGWWTFADPPQVESRIIPDLCYPDKRFVTIPSGMLLRLLRMGQRVGIRFLVDLHAMPCGSSDGTYNGVYPADPIFFTDPNARELGLRVIRNMIDWYLGLPEDLFDGTVWGFTVLNEPGLGLILPDRRPGVTGLANAAPVVSWLTEAVALFEQALHPEGPASVDGPKLYMNLVEVAFPGDDTYDQMAAAMAAMGLSDRPWAVFDVHHYFAWGGMDGSGIPPDACATEDDLAAYVRSGMDSWTQSVKGAAAKHGLTGGVACSEWSLSLHHTDYVAPCALNVTAAMQVMHREQKAAFERADMGHFFWGWRMPYGGVHETKWSLKRFLTGKH